MTSPPSSLDDFFSSSSVPARSPSLHSIAPSSRSLSNDNSHFDSHFSTNTTLFTTPSATIPPFRSSASASDSDSSSKALLLLSPPSSPHNQPISRPAWPSTDPHLFQLHPLHHIHHQHDYLAPTPTPSSPPSLASSSDLIPFQSHPAHRAYPYQQIPLDLDSCPLLHLDHPSPDLLPRCSPQPPQSSPRVVPFHHPPSSHRSKRPWFSSRRQKRKHSIHALSATSSSSSASLRSTFVSAEPSLKKLDALGLKFPSSSSSPRRSSHPCIRNLSKPILFLSKLVSLRWLRKSLAPNQPLGFLLGLVAFLIGAVSFTTFLIHFLDTDKEPLPWRSYCQEQPEFPHQYADSLDPVNVFVGVFSVDSSYERRHLIRSTYARHSRPYDPQTGLPSHNLQLKFILGRPRLQHARSVALEMETFNDVVILDIPENMNRGKTLAYFNWAHENATVPVFHPKLPFSNRNLATPLGFQKVDFVVKADDDAFIVLSELERHLRVAPRTNTYWGYLIRNLFMGGECYALSSDLVHYVATSERVLEHLTGAEDKKMAKWMRIHPNASHINWVSERCWIYDHPKSGTTYAHGFLFPDEVERIREEGRFGLSPEELHKRGPNPSQAYSTVIKWKQRYVAPKNLLTMEEEVEALVEGGGRFHATGYKRPADLPENLVPIEELILEPGKDRWDEVHEKENEYHQSTGLSSDDVYNVTLGPKTSSPMHTLPVRNKEPSLKLGRPPSELIAKMPEMEDLPESELKQALRRVRDAKKEARTSESTITAHQKPASTPSSELLGSSNSTIKPLEPSARSTNKLVPLPTLQYDAEEIVLRRRRFSNRPHGGTVVVHFLKRNEWFLETSLVLLGKSKTWVDNWIPAGDGVPVEPTFSLRSPSGSSGSSARSSLSDHDDGSMAEHQAQQGPSRMQAPNSQSEKQAPVGQDSHKKAKAAGIFGGARMYGSPLISADGRIREGRVVVPFPPGNSSAGSSFSSSLAGGAQEGKQKGGGETVNGGGAGGVGEDDGQDEFRRSQFGGAGWIRGKPRVRVADPADGPDLLQPTPSGDAVGTGLQEGSRGTGKEAVLNRSLEIHDNQVQRHEQIVMNAVAPQDEEVGPSGGREGEEVASRGQQ